MADDGGWPDDEDQCTQEDAEHAFWLDVHPAPRAAPLPSEPPAPAAQAAGAGASRSFDTVFTNAKAGMTGVDAEYVKRVVYEMSKDSPFFAEAQRRDAVTAERCAALQAKMAALSRPVVAGAERALAQRRRELEAARDLSRTWLCVDMDMFFAACEIRERPALADVPNLIAPSAP